MNKKEKIDNIVNERGALYMADQKAELESKGYTVIHFTTDSIKVIEPVYVGNDPSIIDVETCEDIYNGSKIFGVPIDIYGSKTRFELNKSTQSIGNIIKKER